MTSCASTAAAGREDSTSDQGVAALHSVLTPHIWQGLPNYHYDISYLIELFCAKQCLKVYVPWLPLC